MEDNNLKECLRIIEEKVGKGKSQEWTDGVFAQISDEILAETKVVLSKNTLKRLFGKMRTPNDYHPQRETRNALAKFAGYENWNQFVVTKTGKVPDVNQDSVSIKLPRRNTWLVVAAILLVGLAAWYFTSEPQPPPTNIPLSLTIKNPVDTAPYTLVAKYDSTYEGINSCILSLGDEFQLSSQSSTYTEFMELPVFTWLFVKNGKDLIFSQTVHALSKGWEAFYQKKKKYTKVPNQVWKKPGKVSFDKKWFADRNLDTSRFEIQFRNVKNFELDGDNFTFETRVLKHSQLQSCSGNTYKIFGEGGHLEVSLFSPFCAQHNFINLNELFISGRTNDLTDLGHKVGEYLTIKMEVKNKNLKLTLDGKACFDRSYTKSMGKVKAIIFGLSNFNDIDYIKAWDAKGELVENHQF